MPEGDTIHALATSLRAALVPGLVAAFEPVGPGPEPGERVEDVTSRGKHLLIRFGSGMTLHTHLGMRGSWRIGPPGRLPSRRPGPPGHGVAAFVVTERAAAVCRDTRVVEVLDDMGVRRHPWLSTLGPDLCAPDADPDEIARRLARHVDRDTAIAEALLDQRVAAGIGNVYRSEVLWACRVDPFAAVGSLEDSTKRALYSAAGRLLRSNLDGGPRRTVTGGLAVYERGGRPCPRCGERVRSRRIGDGARTVWWCPRCQAGDR